MEMVKVMDVGDVFVKIEFEISEIDVVFLFLKKISLFIVDYIVEWFNKIDKGEFVREV